MALLAFDFCVRYTDTDVYRQTYTDTDACRQTRIARSQAGARACLHAATHAGLAVCKYK